MKRAPQASIGSNAAWLTGLALLCLFALNCQPVHAQVPASSSKEKPMQHYALIFHTTRSLTPEEQKSRGPEILDWVKAVNGKGITLDPRAFGETVATLSQQQGTIVSRNGSSDPALVNIVFFDAPGKDEALEIARLHPGLHYGVTVELREWNTPRPLVAAQ